MGFHAIEIEYLKLPLHIMDEWHRYTVEELLHLVNRCAITA